MSSLLFLVVIGGAAGLLATRLMKVNTDLPTTMGIGVLGALFGAFVLRLIVTVGGWAITFVLAAAGSMALIWLWQRFRRKARGPWQDWRQGFSKNLAPPGPDAVSRPDLWAPSERAITPGVMRAASRRFEAPFTPRSGARGLPICRQRLPTGPGWRVGC